MIRNISVLRRKLVLPLAFAFLVTAGGCFRDPAAPNPPDDGGSTQDPVDPSMVFGDGKGSAPWIA